MSAIQFSTSLAQSGQPIRIDIQHIVRPGHVGAGVTGVHLMGIDQQQLASLNHLLLPGILKITLARQNHT
nr:hypothetical protein [Nitrincola sp. A-D6]